MLMKYAASMDQGGELQYFAARPQSPPENRRKRPPLQHGKCFEESIDYELGGAAAAARCSPAQHRQIDETVDETTTPSAGESSGSFDMDLPLVSEVFREQSEKTNQSMPEILETSNFFGESVEQTYERNYKNRTSEYFYDRAAGPSSSLETPSYFHTDSYDFSLNDPLQTQRISVTALFEKFCEDEREPRPMRQLPPIRQQSESNFRVHRLRGISSDRLTGNFVKKRGDRISTSSLGDQPASGSCFTIFDKRKGKLGRLEKSKRLSASALYDQSPTAFNRRSHEIYKKFNSEEFKKTESYEKNLPSTSRSDNSVSKFRYENPLERASVAKLYEKFCYDDKPVTIEMQPIKRLAEKEPSLESQNEPKSARTEPFSAASLSERTSDIMSSTLLALKSTEPSIFNFDFDSILQQQQQGEILSENPSISPDRSCSNTIQLLFEDPRSNRTSISDLYEPCFSVSLAPKRPSFKARHWDLNTLDLRPIDDESPTTSKFTSSPDDVLLHSDVLHSEDIFDTSLNEHSLNGKIPVLEDIDEDDDSDKTSLSESLIPKSMSSRPSMHKLQPYKPKDDEPAQTNHEQLLVDDMNKLTTNCTTADVVKESKSFFRVRKVKDKDSLSVRKRTRCFPL